MVTTRHKRETSRSAQNEAGADAAEGPSTSSDMQGGHAFVPPKKGGRGALRRRKEPSPADIGDQRVQKLLEAIAGQLKARGLASSAGSASWTSASVSEGLMEAVGLLPPALQEALRPDDTRAFGKHVDVLLELLGGDASKERKKQKRPKATKAQRRSVDVDMASEMVCDASLDDLVSSWVTGTVPDVDTCAAAVMARVPASHEALRALCAKGRMDPGQVLRACVAVAGLCEHVDERVAAFSVFTDLVAGGGVPENVVTSAVSSVHAVLQGSTGHTPKSIWTMWGANHKDDAFGKASNVCYRLVEARVAAQVSHDQASTVTEDNLGDLTKRTVHTMHLLSPYAFIGLLTHVHREKSASMNDVVMLAAVLTMGGPTTALSHNSTNTADQISDTSAYLLYLYLARCAILATADATLVTLSHKLEQKAGATMPPESIRAWMEDQPPSSTIQLLMEKSSHGLPEMSAYLIEKMQLEDLHALATLSMTGLGEQERLAEDGQDRSAMDDLLFFESTEGALNVFPGDWEEDEDEDLVIELPTEEGDGNANESP